MKESHSHPEDHVIERGHEVDSVNKRLMIFSVIGLVGLMAFALLLVYLLMSFMGREQAARTEPARKVRATPDAVGVRFTADQPQQLQELRDAESLRLQHYEWVDQPEGIARIPIERAIDILAEKGLPENKPKSEEQDDTSNPQ